MFFFMTTMPRPSRNYFLQERDLKINVLFIFLFFVLCFLAWAINVFSQIAFPSQSFTQQLIRIGSLVVGALIMIVGSNRLLKKNNIPPEALGLRLSVKSMLGFTLGAIVGVIVLIAIGSMLYVFVPYHFEIGPLQGWGLLKEASMYFWGNFLEELMFRGYPLIVFSQLFGWRKAVWIMALPFGLFHLPGLGLSIDGLKMIITTATYSFVFSYSFILTGTLWTAIGVHVVSNIVLHSISGLDGLQRAMFIPVFDANWPINYDPGLLSCLVSVVIISFGLYSLIKRNFQL
jgi:membrane protease YdiL (CAAX protease family)